MSVQCPCMIPIYAFLPKELLEIIQSYLHTKIKERLYRLKCKKFKFHVYLDKELNTIEELKTGLTLNNIANFFLIAIKKDIKDSAGRWLCLNFTVDNTTYYFSTCLTADITQTKNGLVQFTKNSYQLFYRKLLQYFGEGSKDILLAEIISRCQVTPNKEDFNKIWFFLHDKVLDFISNINFWSKFHR